MPNRNRDRDDHHQQPRAPAVGARVSWWLVCAAWSVPALADTADVFITERIAGHPIDVWRAFARAAPAWYYWAALTPAIFWLARQLPLRRPVRARIVAGQLGLSVVAGLGHGLVIALRPLVLEGSTVHAIRADYLMAISDWLPISIVMYWAVLGVCYAIDNFQRYREQELRASELATRLARSELAMLRAQLHPHFLFNALNTVASLVRANEPERGVRVLTHLGDLLRHVLRGDPAQESTLREELAVLRSYSAIEVERFGNRLTIDVAVPDALLDAMVPSLILQPLVENAVRHGIAPRDAAGRIDVAARSDNGTLHLRVTDNGRGLPADWDPAGASGVGLSNARARLARLYGDAGVLRIAAPAGGGVEVTISLPLIRATDAVARAQ